MNHHEWVLVVAYWAACPETPWSMLIDSMVKTSQLRMSLVTCGLVAKYPYGKFECECGREIKQNEELGNWTEPENCEIQFRSKKLKLGNKCKKLYPTELTPTRYFSVCSALVPDHMLHTIQVTMTGAKGSVLDIPSSNRVALTPSMHAIASLHRRCPTECNVWDSVTSRCVEEAECKLCMQDVREFFPEIQPDDTICLVD